MAVNVAQRIKIWWTWFGFGFEIFTPPRTGIKTLGLYFFKWSYYVKIGKSFIDEEDYWYLPHLHFDEALARTPALCWVCLRLKPKKRKGPQSQGDEA